MWTTILSFVKGKVFSEAGSLLIPLVLILSVFFIWNSDSILTKFGFETKSSLKAEVSRLNETVKLLEESNKKLTEDVRKAEEKEGISTGILSEHCDFTRDVENATDEIINQRKQEAERIKRERQMVAPMATVDPPVRTSVPRESREEALSRNNIQSLHTAYNKFFKGDGA